MSVINQMLKDLDKRQANAATDGHSPVVVVSQRSILPMVLLVVIALVICNIIGWYLWQLYQDANPKSPQLTESAIEPTAVISANTDKLTKDLPQQNTTALAQPIISANKSLALGNDKAASLIAAQQLRGDKASQLQQGTAFEEAKKTIAVKSAFKHESAGTESNDSSPAESADKQSNSVITSDEIVAIKQQPEQRTVQPLLSISRKQLTPAELAEKKFNQAKQAIEAKNVNQAEALLEDALLLTPENNDIRKQLAALWYGRKAYQDATDLLIKGLALTPQDNEMRVMAARIYLEGSQHKLALNLLLPLQSQQDVQIQGLLANTAAQLNDHQTAINAYQRLTILAPSIGRWWLGLAIANDSLAQFEPAKKAYRQALSQQNLSAQAAAFARQRLIELGD